MLHQVSTLVLSTIAFSIASVAEAQVTLRGAPNSAIPTLGQTALPSPEDAFGAFLRDAHPLWARLTWVDAQRNLEVLAINGFPLGEARPARIAPDFVATEIALELAFKNSTLTARRAYLLDDHIVLRDMLLDNDSGQLRASFAVFSQDALTLIAQYLRDQRPNAGVASLLGEVVLNGVTAVSPEFSGERPGQRFSSTFAADLLAFSGMTWGEGEDAPILISGMSGAGMKGSARFGGSAEFSLSKLHFSGSIPDLTRAVTQRLAGEAQADASNAVTPELTAAISQRNAPDTAAAPDGSLETAPAPAAPPPVTHPFALSFSELAYSATRPGETTATIDAEGGTVRGSIVEGGPMQMAARLADMSASAAVFAGTPLEEIAKETAQRAGGRDVKLDLALEAALSADALRLNVACVAIPGLIDISTDIDVTVPGLEKMLTAAPGRRSGSPLDLLFASQARVLAVNLVDQGLNGVLTAAGFAPLGELIESTLLSRLRGQEGMRMVMLQTALAPVTSILSGYDTDGSVALEARFGEATSLPVALVSFLQSAEPVTDAAPDVSRCDTIALKE